MIKEITEDLYPKIKEQIAQAHEEYRANDNEAFVPVFDIFEELRAEFLSLCNYETKLVFPAIRKLFEKGEEEVKMQPLSLSELQALLKKKEEHIRSLMLQLEVAAQEVGLKANDVIFALISILKRKFLVKKDAFHKLLLQLQWHKEA
ncbi:MAG: hypothetical protein QM727_12800 [Niabella sp.]